LPCRLRWAFDGVQGGNHSRVGGHGRGIGDVVDVDGKGRRDIGGGDELVEGGPEPFAGEHTGEDAGGGAGGRRGERARPSAPCAAALVSRTPVAGLAPARATRRWNATLTRRCWAP